LIILLFNLGVGVGWGGYQGVGIEKWCQRKEKCFSLCDF